MSDTFAPSINLNGRTVTPESWMWVLGFAMGGCQWAIEEAATAEFRERCRVGLKAMRDREAEKEIEALEHRIAILRERIYGAAK